MSFSLKSRSHYVFQQNSYCRGVQCACFSKDDNYVYAGLKDRSIIVWSVLDGESFCFAGRTELTSGNEGLCSGSWPLEAPTPASPSWVPLLREVSAGSGDRPNGSLPPLLDPCSGYLELQNTLPTCPGALFRACAGLFPSSILLKVGCASCVHTPRLGGWSWSGVHGGWMCELGWGVHMYVSEAPRDTRWSWMWEEKGASHRQLGSPTPLHSGMELRSPRILNPNLTFQVVLKVHPSV